LERGSVGILLYCPHQRDSGAYRVETHLKARILACISLNINPWIRPDVVNLNPIRGTQCPETDVATALNKR
jgi:hypothetical protein